MLRNLFSRSNPPTRYNKGIVQTNLQLPKSGGGLHPHRTDLFIPNTNIKHCMIALHGASSSTYAKEGFEVALGIRSSMPPTGYVPPTTASQVPWSLLENHNVVVLVPSGQACTGVYDPVGNPKSVNSINSSHPHGIFTWTNEYMYSQYNDYQFLLDAAAYLKSKWPNASINLFGHSNGGMMANKMWYETTNNAFSTFGSCSGPASDYFENFALPKNPKPMWAQYGYKDTTVGLYGDSTTSPVTPGPHWDDPLWQQPYDKRSLVDVNYPRTRSHINWQNELQAKVDAFKLGVTVTEDDGKSQMMLSGTANQSNQKTYSFPKLQLIRVDEADHQIATQQQYTGELVFDRYMNFVESVV